MVSFKLEPGQALGVIGPSGAGKSTLARAMTGVWPPAGGQIRLDGATLDQYDPDVLGSYIGYLPQRVTLFDGTIAENIARLATDPDDDADRRGGAEGRRASDDPRSAAKATTHASARPAGGFPAARSSASDWPVRFMATRCFWCWTSRTQTSTMTARWR